jgi:hypothetical protein
MKEWISINCPPADVIALLYQFIAMLRSGKDGEIAKLAAKELDERYQHVRMARVLESQHQSLPVVTLPPIPSPALNPLMSGSVSLSFILEEVGREEFEVIQLHLLLI